MDKVDGDWRTKKKREKEIILKVQAFHPLPFQK